MKDQVTRALIYYHNHNKEWVSLKEIYKKVEEIRGEPNANGGASIRRLIESHSKASAGFKGEELYISKGIGTGLYKSIYYDRLKFIDSIEIGDVFTRDQLMNIFKINGQSGIMPTNSLKAIVITTSEDSLYGDSGIKDGLIQYTGQGQEGDQEIKGNNKVLYYSKENDIPVYLFTKDGNRKYIFEGKVELYDIPYQTLEKDKNGKERKVWKFPLAIIYPENYELDIDSQYIQVSSKVKKLETELLEESKPIFDDLVFKEGKLNIRKYRKTDIKKNRSTKPDYIAEAIIKNNQGILNEKVIFEYEIKRLMEEDATEQVREMEEFFNNKKENEGFDILSFELDENGNYIEKYIEVKSTKSGEGTPIDITADELDFAYNHKDNYYLYRIIKSESKDRYLKIITGNELIKDNYEFVPVTYKIYSK